MATKQSKTLFYKNFINLTESLRNVAVQIYFTLYSAQCLVDQWGIYYNPTEFSRLHEYSSLYPLTQYRQLYPLDSSATDLNLRKQLQPTRTLVFIKYFTFLFTIRSFFICFVPYVTATRFRRIWLGTEVYQTDTFCIEVSLFCWSAIAFLYLQFSLTQNLLDYKFLALLRIRPQNAKSQFNLSDKEYSTFERFRRLAHRFYDYGIVGAFSIPGPLVGVALYLIAGLCFSDPLPSFIWILIKGAWINIVTLLLFSNLILFIVIAKYLHIKLSSASGKLERSLRHKYHNLSKFWRWLQEFDKTQSEAQDYSRFWSSYLSYVFTFYVAIISFVIYIFILSTASIYLKTVYSLSFMAHVGTLGVIIYFGGSIVQRNASMAATVTSRVIRRRKSKNLSFLEQLKLHNAVNGLSQGCDSSGFRLLNGYCLTFDTYRLLIVNIALYFLLIIINI